MAARIARKLLVPLFAALLLIAFAPLATAAEFETTAAEPTTILNQQTVTSSVKVAGAGKITKAIVDFHGLSSTYPNALDFLLESPTGKYVVLMSDSCGTVPIGLYDFTFDDDSPNLANLYAESCFEFSQRPNNYDALVPDVWDTAPGAVPGPLLSHFNGDNATGTWTLHVAEDDDTPDTGSLLSWKIKFITDEPAFNRIPGSGYGGDDPAVVLTENVTLPARQIEDVDVLLRDFGHVKADDVDIALQAPDGTTMMVVSDACGDATVRAAQWRFDDEAWAALPDESEPPCDSDSSGTWKPTNFDSVEPGGVAGGPAGRYLDALSVFDGKLPGGEWKLYVDDDDDTPGDYGYLVDFDLAFTLKGAKTVTASAPRIAYKKSRKMIRASGRSTLAGAPLSALECFGSVKSTFQRKIVRRKGRRKLTSWKTVATADSALNHAGGACGFDVEARLNKKYAGSQFRVVSAYLGGEYIAPFSLTTTTRIKKLKF